MSYSVMPKSGVALHVGALSGVEGGTSGITRDHRGSGQTTEVHRLSKIITSLDFAFLDWIQKTSRQERAVENLTNAVDVT